MSSAAQAVGAESQASAASKAASRAASPSRWAREAQASWSDILC